MGLQTSSKHSCLVDRRLLICIILTLYSYVESAKPEVSVVVVKISSNFQRFHCCI